MVEQLAIIGCGLMGGSFALALRAAGQVRRIVGYSRTRASAEQARALGIIDAVAATPADAASGSDLVLLSVPVAATGSVLAELRASLGPQALCMDVGSIKRDVMQAAHRALGEAIGCFVGAHPIAGKEHAGIAHADAALYRDRQVVLTPDATSDPARVARARDCWEAVGARVIELDPQAHDRAFAAVSHLPHLIAFASFEAVAAQEDGEALLALAGPGFRDFTRIAAGEPAMWRDILLANRDEVRAQAARFRAALDSLEALLEGPDSAALHDRLTAISARRARWRMRGRFD